MVTDRARTRCRERLRLLASSRLTPEEVTEEALGALRQAIGFDGPSCWVLADPASSLPTGHEITDADAAFHASVPRLTALHQGHGAASDRASASGEEPVTTLSLSTGGDLAMSQLWDECFRPHGVGDCFFLACRDRQGCWGWVNASREAVEAPFGEEDVKLLQDVSASLGATMRQLMTERPEAPADTPAGVILLDDHLREISWTASAREWLGLLRDGRHWDPYGLLPPAVYAVAARVLAGGGDGSGVTARARVRTTTGSWAVLDGAALEGDARGRVAVTIRAATGDEILEILCRVYDLTPRERELARLVADGLGTRQVAERLFITPYTVKDHLKAVFAKVGVETRGELVSRMTGA